MIRPASSMIPIKAPMARDEHVKLPRIVRNMQAANTEGGGTATSEYGLYPSASRGEDERTQNRHVKWSLEKTNRDSRGFSGIR